MARLGGAGIDAFAIAVTALLLGFVPLGWVAIRGRELDGVLALELDGAIEHGYGWIAPLTMVAAGVCAGAMFRAGARVFLGWGATRDDLLSPEPDENPQDRDASVPLMWAVTAVMIGLGLIASVVPGLEAPERACVRALRRAGGLRRPRPPWSPWARRAELAVRLPLGDLRVPSLRVRRVGSGAPHGGTRPLARPAARAAPRRSRAHRRRAGRARSRRPQRHRRRLSPLDRGGHGL